MTDDELKALAEAKLDLKALWQCNCDFEYAKGAASRIEAVIDALVAKVATVTAERDRQADCALRKPKPPSGKALPAKGEELRVREAERDALKARLDAVLGECSRCGERHPIHVGCSSDWTGVDQCGR